MKKGDIFIMISVALAAIFSAVLIFTHKTDGKTVTVKENNKLIYNGSLYENKEIILSGNTVEIKNGAVSVIKADCKNQICVNHKSVKAAGESIVCLPNKVIVEIN